ncbi:hypothetical protein N7492_005747 [Penicillium capsulatum]|uniref:Alpha/beta hydrolase fold-3 domain-containing protein n=1 Tax=Penicillium capsulatum TaxID=69766 RepID=A0A9W9LRB1_9EURO|nr:hypothetical protein N7492_005747 [Penicillium capsulatum]KAJ6135153.1 hypothetical protein N7512_000313 [Penicillium capsulatum]
MSNPGLESVASGNSMGKSLTTDRRQDSALTTDQSPQHLLASALSATVVTVNYRLGTVNEAESSVNEYPESTTSDSEDSSIRKATQPDFQYPTPIHDTLIGFDWILNTLKPTKLGVFGSHVGGSLSLMLALTEAKSVQAVAALDPVCDWPGLDEYCKVEDSTGITTTRQKRRQKSKTRCFDAFASPILFLRSAGRDVPPVFPRYHTGPEYPVPTLASTGGTALEESGSAQDLDSSLDGDDRVPSESSPPPATPRRRKALSRWPPYGLDYGLDAQRWSGDGHGIGRLQMTLPWVRIFLQDRLAGLSEDKGDVPTGSTVLSHQGEEMVSVMRRACFWGREKGVGEDRVTLRRMERDVEIGAWMGDVLDRERD